MRRPTRVVAVLLWCFVTICSTQKGTECPPGLQKDSQCCGVDGGVQYTCAAPSWYQDARVKGIVMSAYKDKGQCCCCTGNNGRSFAPNDVQAYNDRQNPALSIIENPPNGISMNVASGNAITNGANPGWCQQQQSLPQVVNRNFTCLGNLASCAVQNMFWCAALWRPPTGQVKGDPHLTGFQGTALEFSGVSGASFALISEPHTAVNVLLDDFSMPESATFIKGVGFIHGPSNATITVTSPFASCTGGTNSSATPMVVEVNGVAVDLSSGLVVVRGGKSHLLPGARAEQSRPPRDGKAVMVSSWHKEGSQIVRIGSSTWWIDITRRRTACHLDLAATLIGDVNPAQCGGVLCESLGWSDDSSSGGSLLRGDEIDYMLDTLTSTDFTHSHFGKAVMQSGQSGELRRLLRGIGKDGADSITLQWTENRISRQRTVLEQL